MADYLDIARRALGHPAESVSRSVPDGAAEKGVTSSHASPTPPPEPKPLESVLKGKAVELWSTSSGRLFIVADDEDAALLAEPRGIVYTAAEARRVVRIGDPAIVREIHEWKRQFNGCIRYRRE
jgi:hypothetical protein